MRDEIFGVSEDAMRSWGREDMARILELCGSGTGDGVYRLVEDTSRMATGQVLADMRVLGERMIVEFETKMCGSVRACIEEGIDADAIPYFVEGEWKHFWTSSLIPALEAETRRAEQAIGADIASRLARELRARLTDSVALSSGKCRGVQGGTGDCQAALANLVAAALEMAGGLELDEGWGIAEAGRRAISSWSVMVISGGTRCETLVEESLRQSELVMAISMADLAQIMDDCGGSLTRVIEDAYDRVLEVLEHMADEGFGAGEAGLGVPAGQGV